MSQDLAALAKHIESDVSTIIGFEGPTKGIAKELATKVRSLIDHLEGKEPEPADKPFYKEPAEKVEEAKPAPEKPAAQAK